MNVLLLIGIVILLGVFSGRLFSMIKFPQVTGYILIGLILRPLFGGPMGGPELDAFRHIISLALGIIGFMIGSQLNLERFKRYSRTVYTALFFEAFLTFGLVAIMVTLVSGELSLGLLLGALGAATAPAATYGVLDQYKSRGPLTMTSLSVIALDNAVAIVLFGFVSVFARALLMGEGFSLMQGIISPAAKIALSLFMGALAGHALKRTSSGIRDRDMLLPFVFGTIVFVVGAAILLDVNPILSCMALGAVAANLKPAGDKEVFDVIKKFSSPVFVLFFVLVGARFQADVIFKGGVMLVAAVFLFSRAAGKVAGAYMGGKISSAPLAVRRYLGFCLLDQAGVTVGLAIATLHMFAPYGGHTEMLGLMVVNIVTVTTLVNQLLAPFMIKFAIYKADEAMRNVTEEDIIEQYSVKDVMEADFLVVKENYNLHEVIDIMKKSDFYEFPVVDVSGSFCGVITLGEVRDAFYEEQMDLLVLAGDLVRTAEDVLKPEQPLGEAMEIFQSKNIDYLPVISDDEKRTLQGQLSYRRLRERITKELLLRQQELEKE